LAQKVKELAGNGGCSQSEIAIAVVLEPAATFYNLTMQSGKKNQAKDAKIGLLKLHIARVGTMQLAIGKRTGRGWGGGINNLRILFRISKGCDLANRRHGMGTGANSLDRSRVGRIVSLDSQVAPINDSSDVVRVAIASRRFQVNNSRITCHEYKIHL